MVEVENYEIEWKCKDRNPSDSGESLQQLPPYKTRGSKYDTWHQYGGFDRANDKMDEGKRWLLNDTQENILNLYVIAWMSDVVQANQGTYSE